MPSPYSAAQLLGIAYLSFPTGLGPFLPAVLAWIFRRNASLNLQLLQAALLLTIPWTIALVIFWKGAWELYFLRFTSFEVLASDKWKLIMASLYWPATIICMSLSWRAFRGETFSWPILEEIAIWLQKFGQRKTLRKGALLNVLCPGAGQIFLGKPIWGGVLVVASLVTWAVLAFLLLVHNDFATAKDLVTISGFYFRVEDPVLQRVLAGKLILGVLTSILLLLYGLAFWTLWKRPSLEYRRVMGSAGASYSIHLLLLCILFLVPFIFHTSGTKQAIQQRSEEIYKELKEQEEKLAKKKQAEKELEQLSKDTPSTKKEKEWAFDLVITEEIEGLNDFSDRPFRREPLEKDTKPKISISPDGEQPPPEETSPSSNPEQARQTKSYSEYLSAKVREGGRDQLIWEASEGTEYAAVVEYIIGPTGHLREINLVERSGNLQVDSLVISVLESMDPLVPPPEGQSLRIIELFWNTGPGAPLHSKLKRSLANHPDGRIISSIER